MFCGKCGTNNPENVKFCSNCGAQLANPGAPAPTPAPASAAAPAAKAAKSSAKTYTMVGIGIVAIAAVILLVLISSFFGRGYKSTVKKYIKAAYSGDGKAIVSLIPKKAVKDYLKQKDCKKSDLIDDIDYELKYMLNNIGKSWTYTYKIDEVEDYDKDDLKELKKDYKEDYGIRIKDAKYVSVKISITLKDYNYDYTDTVGVPVVKIGSSWYLDIDNMSLL